MEDLVACWLRLRIIVILKGEGVISVFNVRPIFWQLYMELNSRSWDVPLNNLYNQFQGLKFI